jgi:sodium transport system permease protein
MNPIGVLLKKELVDSLRDRRTLAVMLLFPLFLYPLLITLVGFVMVAGKERLAREQLDVAVVGSSTEKLLSKKAVPANTRYVPMTQAEAEKALRDEKIWAIVTASVGSEAALAEGQQVEVTIRYTKRHDRSIEALERLRKVVQEIAGDALDLRLSEAKLPATFAQPIRSSEVDIDFEEDLGPLIASRLLPVMLLTMLFVSALYPAIDATAGEKERGTLETLLVAPVRPQQVMAAKFFAVVIISVAATLANLAAMALTFRLGLSVDDGMSMRFSFSAGQVLTILLCLAPATLMVSGISMAVASLARSFKEGQSLLSPVTLLATLPGMVSLMPGIELNAGTAAIPLLNIALLIKATALGAAQPLHVAIAIASVMACSVGAIWLAANAFQSEAVRFGGADNWRELFFPRARRSISPPS